MAQTYVWIGRFLFAVLPLAGLVETGSPALAQRPTAAPNLQPTAAPNLQPPAQADAAFELRIIRVGKTFQGIRFHRRSGESWLANGDAWERIPETAAVPAGDYEIIMVGTDEELMAFRLEQRSGTTWQLRGRRWIQMKEPKE